MRATVTPASAPLATGARPAVDSSLLLKNATGTASIFLEVGSPATSTAGFEWAPGDGPLSITLDRGETLNATLAAGQPDQTVHVLRAGK